MSLKRHMLSYLAGVFDGEGSICIIRISPKKGKRPTPTYRGVVEIAMTERLILQLFQNIFGGDIYQHKPRNPQNKLVYLWRIRDFRCIAFLNDLMPFLILKHPQAEVMMHFLKNKPQRGRKGQRKGLEETELALREVDYIMTRSMNMKGKKEETPCP